MHTHKTLWALMRNSCTTTYDTCTPMCNLCLPTFCTWAPTYCACTSTCCAWSSKHVSSFTHFVHPLVADGLPHYCDWTPMLLSGCAIRQVLEAHVRYLHAHEKFGASCVLFGRPQDLMGIHMPHRGRVCTTHEHPSAYTRCERGGHGRVYVCARHAYVDAHCVLCVYTLGKWARYGHALCTPARKETATTPYPKGRGLFRNRLGRGFIASL